MSKKRRFPLFENFRKVDENWQQVKSLLPDGYKFFVVAYENFGSLYVALCIAMDDYIPTGNDGEEFSIIRKYDYRIVCTNFVDDMSNIGEGEAKNYTLSPPSFVEEDTLNELSAIPELVTRVKLLSDNIRNNVSEDESGVSVTGADYDFYY